MRKGESYVSLMSQKMLAKVSYILFQLQQAETFEAL